MSHLKSELSDDWKETYPWLYRVDVDPYSAKFTICSNALFVHGLVLEMVVFLISVSIVEQLSISILKSK